ncbi:MAG TPA: hypothetical protein PKD28_02975 [Candidatus Saccharibacteria bacterium]|nr:hypothetical protein [Candidatus Saccharibacteria bacterium]
MKHLKGFTIVEIAVVILIIAVLVTLSVASYQGLRERAAKNTVLSDLQNAGTIVEQYALKHGGEFPDTDYLVANFNNTKDVNLSVVVSGEEEGGGSTGPVYSNLTSVQNGVLFHTICTNLANDNRPDVPELKYGQGYQIDRNTGQPSRTVNYLWGPTTCNVYNNPEIQINGAYATAGATLNVPISEARLLQEATKSRTDQNAIDFPDYNHVVNQFYQTIHDRFVAQGGTWPITTFWDPWANQWSGVRKEELPVLPPVTGGGGVASGPNEITKSYCIIATHERYPDVIYSFSSDSLTPKAGNCNDTIDN